ncbi:MAG: extracellular solute-binding protein [Acidimicrobiia bacterium]|nr:extracellular solute-binding protein [Acidimicrobiia bacterium]
MSSTVASGLASSNPAATASNASPSDPVQAWTTSMEPVAAPDSPSAPVVALVSPSVPVVALASPSAPVVSVASEPSSPPHAPTANTKAAKHAANHRRCIGLSSRATICYFVMTKAQKAERVKRILRISGGIMIATVNRADDPMPIDPDLPVPLWFQLKEHLLDEIVAGQFDDGAQLPTEHALCEEYGISRTPVHRALAELADEGVILRHRRRGTFVNPHWKARRSHLGRVRVVVPDSSWAPHLNTVTEEFDLSVAEVPLGELRVRLVRAIGEGNAPDLALIDSVWVHEFAEAGFLYPLEELDSLWIRDVYEGDFLEPFVSGTRRSGVTWAVQAETDVAGLWYRKDGVQTAPTTWEEWSHLATSRDLKVAIPAGVEGGEAATYVLLAVLASNGAAAVTPHNIPLTTGPALDALRFLLTLTDTDLLAEGVTTADDAGAVAMLADGRAGFMIGGSYHAEQLARLTGTDLPTALGTFGFVPLPRGPNGPARTLAGGMVWAVPRQAVRPKEAMQVIRVLSESQPLADMANRSGQLPPRRAALELVSDVRFLRDTGSMLEGAMVRPGTVAYPRVSQQLAALLEVLLAGAADPDRVASSTAERIAAITGLPIEG